MDCRHDTSLLLGVVTCLLVFAGGCDKQSSNDMEGASHQMQRTDCREVREQTYRASSTEGVPDSTISYSYDNEGRLVREKRYSGTEDDEALHVVTYSYDENRRVRAERYDGAYVGGEIEQLTVYTYDGDQQTEKLIYNGSEDEDHLTERHKYKYDDEGNRVWAGVDGIITGSPTGEFKQKTLYEYDDQGRRTRKKIEGGVNYGPDEVQAVVSYSYENGRRVRAEKDGGPPAPPDGEPDKVISHEYDERGRRVRTAWDGGYEGEKVNSEPNWIETYEYDDRGNRVTSTLDFDADGEPNKIVTRMYECS